MKTVRQEVLYFISLIRNSHELISKIFTNGSCLYFALILKNRFPSAQIYYNSDHVITKISDRYYDITGEVHPREFYLPISKYGKNVIKSLLHNINK